MLQLYFLTGVPLAAFSSLFFGEFTSSVRSITPSSVSSESDSTITVSPFHFFFSTGSSSFILTISSFTCCNLSSALCNSGASSACLARPCQLMALSVRHCNASPSGRRTGNLCSATSRARMVSSRGRRDRWHRGQRKRVFQSHQQRGFERCVSEEPSSGGKGTQPPWNQSLHRWHRWSKGRGGPLHTHTDWLGLREGVGPPFSSTGLSELRGVSVSIESLCFLSILMPFWSPLAPFSTPGFVKLTCWRRRRASFSRRSPSLNAITWYW